MNLRLFKLLYRKWWFGTPSPPPYKHVVQIGDPVLRQVASPVDPTQINSDSMKLLYKRLYYLMKVTKAVGLAAPQIGVSLRVFAVHVPEKKNHPNPASYEQKGMQHIPLQIWVNPVMKVLDYKKNVAEEGCESMLGFKADIPRYNSILLTGLNEEGNEKKLEVSGCTARVFQHEMDHLDGKFFTDIMLPKSLNMTNWDAVNYYEGRIYTTYMPKR